MDDSRKIERSRAGSTVAGVLALVWMCVIFAFSAQTSEESSEVSNDISYRIVNTTGLFFHLHIDEEKIREIANAMENFVRKTAHMTEYAILAVLLYVWLGRWRLSCLQRARTAAVLAVLYACSDEIHQLFVAGRAGRVSDVLIDSAGAVLALAVLLLKDRIAGRRR